MFELTLQNLTMPLLNSALVVWVIFEFLSYFTKRDTQSLDERAEHIFRTNTFGRVERTRRQGKLVTLQIKLRDFQATIGKKLLAISPRSPELRQKLYRAGFRQTQAPLYYFVIRTSTAFGLFTLAMLYAYAMSLFPFRPFLGVGVVTISGFLGFFLPKIHVVNCINKRTEQVLRYWQDALDLLIISVESGSSLDEAMNQVSKQMAATAPVLAQEFVITLSEMSLLQDRRDAFSNLSDRVDLPTVHAATIAFIQATKQGASIGQALRKLAMAHRAERINNAERKAASLGPKMTLPMILFFLPVIFVVIIAPLFLDAP